MIKKLRESANELRKDPKYIVDHCTDLENIINKAYATLQITKPIGKVINCNPKMLADHIDYLADLMQDNQKKERLENFEKLKKRYFGS